MGLFLFGCGLVVFGSGAHVEWGEIYKYLGLMAMAPSPFLGLGAILLRHPEWRSED